MFFFSSIFFAKKKCFYCSSVLVSWTIYTCDPGTFDVVTNVRCLARTRCKLLSAISARSSAASSSLWKRRTRVMDCEETPSQIGQKVLGFSILLLVLLVILRLVSVQSLCLCANIIELPPETKNVCWKIYFLTMTPRPGPNSR